MVLDFNIILSKENPIRYTQFAYYILLMKRIYVSFFFQTKQIMR